MAYGTVNADVIQTSTSGGVLGAGNASIMKNRLINGNMVIDQRNAGASVAGNTGGVFVVDRWISSCTVSAKFNGQQNAGSVTPPAGFTNYLGITSTSAYSVLTGDTFLIQQSIEGFNVADLGFGTANAKTVTLSFWVRSSLTGTFGGSLVNGGALTGSTDRNYPFSYTITSANTWTQISVTIAGDTTGTWVTNNGAGMSVRFGLGSGATYSGTAGAWVAGNIVQPTGNVSVVGTNGATFYITGVQLEVGSSATGFEYRQYGTELSLCQRYLPAFGTGNASLRLPCAGICASTSSAYITVNFPVTTRVPPTGISISAASHFTVNVDGIVSSNPTGLVFTSSSSVNANRINATGAAGLTTGQTAFLDITNTSGQLLFTGCEL